MTYPVDAIGGVAPLAAYGMRKLVSTYTGPALRVRRGSDNAESDFGFSGSVFNGADLDAFIAGTQGFVKTWYDQSGNGNHATQATTANQPHIDDRNVRGTRVIFFKGGTCLSIPSSVATNTQSLTLLAAMGPTGYNATNGLLELGTNSWLFDQNTFRTQDIGPSAIMQRNGLPICGLRQSASATSLFMDELTQTTSAPTLYSGTGGTIGGMPNAGSYPLFGIASGLIIYGRVLTDPDLANGRTAMHSAFNVPQTKRVLVFAFGDSIYCGSQNLGFSQVNIAVDAIDGVRLCNAAEGGSKIADNISSLGTFFASFISAEAVSPLVLMNGGTNDISQTTDDETTIFGRLSTFCSNVHSAGGRVVIGTLLPSNAVGYTAPRKAVQAALNTLIRSSWPSIADGMIDYAANPIMGASTAPADTALYLDGLHPTEQGAINLVPETAAMLATLL